MPRLSPFAHPRHRQHQAIFPPLGALTSWRLGLGIAGPASHFPRQENKKGWGSELGKPTGIGSQKVRSPTHWRLPLRSSTLFVDALRLNVNVVRQFLKEISMQDARDVRNDLRVQTVVRNTIGIPPTGFVPTAWPTSPPTVLVGRALL